MTYPYDVNTYVIWDYDSIWLADTLSTYNNGYPFFRWQAEAPFVFFKVSPPQSFDPLTLQFHDLSQSYNNGSLDYLWDFGDGETSDQQNPSHTFPVSGNYTVSLTVTNAFDSTATYTKTVVVRNVIADFSASITSGFVPLTVQFSNTTPITITNWQWDFDSDGVIDSEAENPIWTYIFPWTYSVTLTVSNGLDSDTEVKLDYITATLDPSHTLYVPSQYQTIQAAINASVDGDYIIIADGIYYENLLIEGKTITLASYYFIDGDTLHISNTIIDGSNALNPDQASTITILPGGRPVITPHIVGFTIRSGSGRRILQNIGGTTIEKRVGGGIYIRQCDPWFTANKIEDNDADDEGGGSYAFQSIPNLGGLVDADTGLYNPGGNYFRNNQADIGADIYIHGVTFRDEIKLQNCSFEVFSAADSTVSNYWANSSAPLSFVGCSGLEEAITSDIYVATNGSDTANTGLSPSSPFKTIDHALSRVYGRADNPLTIHIASGTYSPSLTGEKFPLQMVSHVSLQGAGQDETFLDAEASADEPRRVLNLDKVEGVCVSGLSLLGGFVTLAKNYNGGGIGAISSGLQLSQVLIANCSSAGDGAGLYAFSSSVLADSVSLAYNAALGSGGGIQAVQTYLQLNASEVADNSVSRNGAGISADAGRILISACRIRDNQATGYQGKGGGISLTNTDSTAVCGNLIKGNRADHGSGLYLQGNANLSLDRNRILNNLADYNGGGLFVNTTSGLFSNNLIANNTATQRGGGLYCYSSPQLVNNTISHNKAGLQGGGLFLNTGSPDLANSLLWQNVSGESDTPNQIHLCGEESDPDIDYCDLQGGSAGITLDAGISYSGSYQFNLDADPLFVSIPGGAGYYYDAGLADFSLLDGSPCIDSGDPGTDITLFPLDLNGDPRIDNNLIDMGALEYFHYFGPRIQAEPQSLSFGRVNINADPPSLELTLSNTGNLPLQISNLTWQSDPSPFSYSFSHLNQDILPGQSVTLAITYAPTAIGEQGNTLFIHNNSLNQSVLGIAVSGTGIDASSSTPGNVQLSIIGDDVHLSWDPVTSDPEGNPFTPDGYIVLYSENADVLIDNYFFLYYTPDTTYVHSNVVHFRNKMFYRVIAYSGLDRELLSQLCLTGRWGSLINWEKLKQSLYGMPRIVNN